MRHVDVFYPFISRMDKRRFKLRTCPGSPSQSPGLGLENRPLCGSDSVLAILAIDSSARIRSVFAPPIIPSPQAATSIQNGFGLDISPISQVRTLRLSEFNWLD